MVTDQYDKVQRELNFAVVDEVDSILIDEARTPLIISGQADGNIHGGIEVLGGGGFLDQLCCFKGAVDAAGVDFLGGGAVSLRTLSHVNSLCQKNCVVRAESRGPFHDE